MRTTLTLLLLAFISLPAWAQTDAASMRPDPQKPVGENMKVPPAWEVRLDRPSADVVIGDDQETADIWFVSMTPGWHITTGPSGIFYHPASTANGTYRAQTEIHLFDPGSRQREAFGLFIGGQDLEGDAQAYTYFLIRNTGDYLIKQRKGASTSTVQDWTPHAGIVKYEASSGSSVKNTLAIEVGDSAVDFYINGEKVATQARGDVDADGIVGLRVNHGLNLHVSDLSVAFPEE